MKTKLIQESLKLEGELFKIGKRLDKSQDLNEAVRLRKEHDTKKARHDQYLMILNEIEKKEKLKNLKRRMTR